jgi:hypothetical protein
MDFYLSNRSCVMPCEEEILKADELCKDDCILEPEVIVTVKEEVKVSAEDLEFISYDIYINVKKCI